MQNIHISLLKERIIFLFVVALAFLSCTKKEVVVIDDNTAPPDSTIEIVIKETYVNKLYISLLGRKPTADEQYDGLVTLDKNNMSKENREELVSLLFEQEEYKNRIYEIAINELLPGVDTSYFGFLAKEYEKALETMTDPILIEIFENELKKVEAVRHILPGLIADSVSVIDMYKRLINNEPYDEINMGTENFILSLFQYFLVRYPTDGELTSATIMVDGSSSVVFYKEGDSKEDFIEIFFSYDEFYEGQVRALYQRYLYREPLSEEMTSLAVSYKNSGDYQALQKAILVSDEYAGIFYN